MTFNTQAALKAGYTQQEIDNYLKGGQVQTPTVSQKPVAQPVAQSVPVQTLQPQQNLLQSILGAVTKPAVDYGKYVGEAGSQLIRLLTEPKFREAVKASNQGKELSPEQSQAVLSKPSTTFIDESKLKNRGEILKTGAKATAGAASYAIPGGSTVKGLLATGALAGGAQAYSQNENVATGAVLGGAGGVILGKAIPGLFNKVKSTGVKVAQNIGEDAASRVTKASPTAFKNAAEFGIDLNKTIAKYAPAGSSLEDLVGTVTQRGKGGVINTAIQNAEKPIQQAIKQSGNKIVATTDELIQPLLKMRDKISVLPGETPKIAALDDFIANTQELYPKGFTAKELLTLKRAFDEQFGKAVVEETTGAVTTSAQKMLTNKARDILKKSFPVIKDSLDTESELYTLRPILNHARAIGKTQGSTIRKGSLSALTLNPATWVDSLTSNPKISTMLAKLQNIDTPLATTTPTQDLGQLGQILAPTMQRGIGIEQTPQIPELPEQPQTPDVTQQATEPQGQQITSEMLQEAITVLKPSEYKKLKDIYDLQQTSSGKPLSGPNSVLLVKAKTAEKALKSIETKLFSNGELNQNLLYAKKFNPLSQGGRQLGNEIVSAIDILGYFRTGAAITEDQRKDYLYMFPSYLDDKDTVKQKLDNLKAEFKGYADGISKSGGAIDTLQNMGVNLQ